MNTNTTRTLVAVPTTVTVKYVVAAPKAPRFPNKAARKLAGTLVAQEIFRAENRFYYGA